MWLPALNHDHVGMRQHEPLPEVDVIILRQSKANRRILEDLCVAGGHCCDQYLARLPDRENCKPVAFLLSRLSTQLIITIDDPGESSPDGSRIFTELSDAVEGKKTGTCNEQAHLSWSTLATEDVSDRLLRRMILVGVRLCDPP